MVCSVFRSEWFAVAFPVLTILYGIFMIISGVGKIQWAMDLLRLRRKSGLPAISAILSIVFGFVILQSPFETTEILWTFTGIAMVVEAIIDIVSLIYVAKNTVPTEKLEVIAEIEKK